MKLILAILLVSLSIPARGADSGASKAAESQPAPSPGSAPSLEQVIDLLRVQGQELDALRGELREQKELTARLEARIDSTSNGSGITEAASSVQPAPPAGAAQADLAQKVATLEIRERPSKKD
jgi:hypothetical protein